MNANATVTAAIARRTAQGLKLTFDIPASPSNGPRRGFTCYAKNDSQKAMWMERAKANGWTLKA
jgi:hypothetical protein